MNPTIRLILIIFIMAFATCIVFAVIMAKMQREGKLEAFVQGVSDAMGITPMDYSQTYYAPTVLPTHHTERNLYDADFGKAVEIIESRKIRNIIMGIIWIALGCVILGMNGTMITDTTNTAGYIVGKIVVIVVAVGCIIYGFYRFSFLGREIVLYERGLTYKNSLLQKKRLPYGDMIRISVGKEYARGVGSTNIPQKFGMKYYIFNSINFRTVFRIFIKEKTITGENKHIEFWEIHYKYLPEKAENFKESMHGCRCKITIDD